MTVKHQRYYALIALLVISAITYISFAANVKGSPDDVLAEIDGKKFTRAMYDNEFNAFSKLANPQAVEHYSTAEGKIELLNELVELNILGAKGFKDGINKTDEYKKLYHEALVDRFAGEFLQNSVNNVKVEEAEAKKYYEENKAKFCEPDSYHVFQIVTNSKEKAEKLKKEIESGKSFIETAKNATDDSSDNKDCDKGYITLNSVFPEVAAALSSQAKDKISDPIEISNDFYMLVKYTDKKAGTQKEYNVVSMQIKREMLMKRQEEAFDKALETMKKSLKFEVIEKNAEPLRKGQPITDEEKKLIVVKCEGKDYPLSELDAELQQLPVFIRPQALAGEGLSRFVKQFYSRILALAYAEKNFADFSKQYASVEADVVRRTTVKMVYDKKLSTVSVSDDEVKAFYEEHKEDFKKPMEMKAHHILVADEEKAKEILENLKKDPSKFEEIAKKDSTCPSGKNGGDLGSFGEGQMVPEFDNACKTAEIGKLVGPVKTQFGYHIIRVDERTDSSIASLDEVKDEIRNEMLPQKQQSVFQAYINELKKELNVKVYPENL